MDISKISGIVHITNGKLDLTALLNDGVEIKHEVDKFLTMKAVMDSKYFNFEKEEQIRNKDTSPYKLPKEE